MTQETGALLQSCNVKTIFGLVPILSVPNWPVSVSYDQANAYAMAHGMRLPSEMELFSFMRKTPQSIHNIGFQQWIPVDVNDEGYFPQSIENKFSLGNLWEWSQSVLSSHEGFIPSEMYPGYTSDFFDGKHNVLVGGSWATVPRIAARDSFRNWYQRGYGYVFAGFRCVKISNKSIGR